MCCRAQSLDFGTDTSRMDQPVTSQGQDDQEWPLQQRTVISSYATYVKATSTPSTIPGVRKISDQTVRNRLEMLGLEQDVLLELLSWTSNTVKADSNGHRHTEYGPSSNAEQFGLVMNPDSCYSVKMVEPGYTGGEMNVLLRIESMKPTDLVAVVCWCGEQYLTPGGLNWCMSTVHWRLNGTVVKFCNTMLFPLCRIMTYCSSMTTLGHIQQGWQLPIYRETTFGYFLGHPNRQIWTPLNTFGMNRIDASENDNRHHNRYSSSWLRYRLSEQTFHTSDRNLMSSMGRRCVAVIDARGGHTRYWKMVTLTCECATNCGGKWNCELWCVIQWIYLYKISYIFSLVLVLHSAEKFIMHFIVWKVQFPLHGHTWCSTCSAEDCRHPVYCMDYSV
jgi:hypothetical protein